MNDRGTLFSQTALPVNNNITMFEIQKNPSIITSNNNINPAIMNNNNLFNKPPVTANSGQPFSNGGNLFNNAGNNSRPIGMNMMTGGMEIDMMAGVDSRGSIPGQLPFVGVNNNLHFNQSK